MKKWFYIFMLSLMVICGLGGCDEKESDTDKEDAKQPTPLHITIPKKRKSSLSADIDEVSIVDRNGELLFECITENNIYVELKDEVMVVTIPGMNDSCFDENGNLLE